MSKVWLVTGSASGLGRNIAEAVLASGDRLVATARDPRRLEDLVKKYGDQIRTAPCQATIISPIQRQLEYPYRCVLVPSSATIRIPVPRCFGSLQRQVPSP